ncbi:MAG: hypothetical protein H6822_23475 [Planctomycetaceae bacterium]|nr:hypothetical protein [Planctomycetales bacterium]MCB9925160.1 hypothetical protein [Planctomycetaceae bacterium]
MTTQFTFGISIFPNLSPSARSACHGGITDQHEPLGVVSAKALIRNKRPKGNEATDITNHDSFPLPMSETCVPGDALGPSKLN